MWVYAVRRAAVLIPVLIGVLTVLFVLVSMLPPLTVVCSYGTPSGKTSPCTSEIPCPPPQSPSSLCPNPVYQSAILGLGLHQPVWVQWAIFVGNGLTFHWGYVQGGSALGTGETGSGLPSLAGQPVATVISQFLPYSIELILLTFAISFCVLLPLRWRMLTTSGKGAAIASRALTVFGFGVPLVFLGVLVLFAGTALFGGPGASSSVCSGNTVLLDFYGSWPASGCTALYGTTGLSPLGYPTWLAFGYQSTPTGFPTLDAAIHGDGWLALDTIGRMLLPALALSAFSIATMFRFLRFDTSEQHLVPPSETLGGRGVQGSSAGRRVARRYLLANSRGAVGPGLLATIAMLPVVEITFNLWGLGRISAYAVAGSIPEVDYGLMFGSILAFALTFMVTAALCDVIRAYLDPRLRMRRGTAPSPAESIPESATFTRFKESTAT